MAEEREKTKEGAGGEVDGMDGGLEMAEEDSGEGKIGECSFSSSFT